jgi:hypothetical protein
VNCSPTAVKHSFECFWAYESARQERAEKSGRIRRRPRDQPVINPSRLISRYTAHLHLG